MKVEFAAVPVPAQTFLPGDVFEQNGERFLVVGLDCNVRSGPPRSGVYAIPLSSSMPKVVWMWSDFSAYGARVIGKADALTVVPK